MTMTNTVCLLNMKGGVGKTTLAANLAWHTYRQGHRRVLLIDFDPQFNASQYLMDFDVYKTHVKANGTIASLLIESPDLRLEGKKKPKSAKKSVVRIENGEEDGGYLDLLPSQLELSFVVKNPAQMEFRLEKILEQLRPDYDYIFVDGAPTDSVLTTMALTASNFLLTPVRPDRFSILGFGNLLQTVASFREKSNDPNRVKELGIVFTQVRNNPIDQGYMASIRKLAQEEDQYVFDGVLSFSNTFARAIQDQTPAFETKFAREELKTSIAEIVKEMEKRIEELANDEEDSE